MKLLLIAACVIACGGLYAQTVSDDNQIAPTTQPTTGNVQQGTTEHHCQSFSILRFSNFGDTFQSLAIRNNGTATASDYTQIQIWFDVNDSDTFEPAGPDQLVGTATASAFPVTILSLNHAIPAWSVFNYHISVDVAAGATIGATFDFEVTPVDVNMQAHPVIYYSATNPCVGTTQTITSGGTTGPDQIVVTQGPAGAQPGVAFTTQPVVELRDAGGTLLSADSTTVVTAAITTGTGTTGAVLSSGTSLTAQASGGVCTFTGLTIDLQGSDYTLTFTTSSFTSGISGQFDVGTPQVATQLVITTQPGGAAPGVNFTTQPVVEIRDASNALVTGATHFVAVSLNGGTGGTLSGTLIVQAVGGVATFTDLSINQAGTGYSLTFSAVNLTSATSTSFDVTSGGGSSSSGGGGGGGGGGCAAQPGTTWLWLLVLTTIVAGVRVMRRRV